MPKFLQKKSFHYVYDFMAKEDKLAFLPVAFWFLLGPRERNLLETFQCYTEPLITSIDFSALQTVGRVTSTPVTLTDLDTEGTESLHSRKAIIFCEKKNNKSPGNVLDIMKPPIHPAPSLLRVLEAGQSSHRVALRYKNGAWNQRDKEPVDHALRLARFSHKQLLRASANGREKLLSFVF